MPTEVILPKVDMDMTTGRISQWFRKEGDVVTKGDPLFEIETDKAAMEVEAPASGTLGDVSGAQGTEIAVGAAVAWIYAEGEGLRDGPAAAAPEIEAVEADAPAAPIEGVDPGGERRSVRATPVARRLARELAIDVAGLAGGGPGGRVQREDVEEAARARGPAGPAAPTGEAVSLEAPARSEASLNLVRLRQGDGAPIVLIHGFAAEVSSWRPFLAESPTGITVYGIDLPGHGGSVAAEADGLAAMVGQVEKTLSAHGIESAHLLGHSLGGAVAVSVASGIAVEALSLLLLAPAGLGPDIDTGFTEGFAAATQERAVAAWLRHLVADPSVLTEGFLKATAQARADGRHAAAQLALGRALFSNGTQLFETRSLLGRLSMPVKVVMGTDDRVIPSRHTLGLPGRIALHLFARTGHLPQIEQRAEVGRLLRELVR